MAKKKAAAGINMAQEIRDILKENPGLSVSEGLQKIQAKFPDNKINEGSFQMGFYTARRTLGIPSSRGNGKKVVKKRLPSAPAARPSVDLGALQAAAKFLTDVGDADRAIEAIKQVRGLQLK